MPRRTTNDPAIGQRIRERRTLLGWTIRFAADHAGISHSTWSRIERGTMSADNRFTLAAIAEALRCPISTLTRLPDPVNRSRSCPTPPPPVACLTGDNETEAPITGPELARATEAALAHTGGQGDRHRGRRRRVVLRGRRTAVGRPAGRRPAGRTVPGGRHRRRRPRRRLDRIVPERAGAQALGASVQDRIVMRELDPS